MDAACPLCGREIAHRGSLTIHMKACERKRQKAAEAPAQQKVAKNAGSPHDRAELDSLLRRIEHNERTVEDCAELVEGGRRLREARAGARGSGTPAPEAA